MFKIICCLLWASFALAETAAPKVVNILFLGKTQTGKSSLINIFYSHIMGKKYEDTRDIVVPLKVGSEEWTVNVHPYQEYRVGIRDLGQSQTSTVRLYTAKNDQYVVNLWDAPGFNDANQQITDEQIVKKIATKIGAMSFNAVVVVLRPDEPETFDLMANIARIRNMLPKSASKNIIGVYTRSAASPARGVKNSRAQAFANLLELPQGTTPRVYSMDGSSFFEEVNTEDGDSLAQGRGRWLGDGKVVSEIVSDVAQLNPFDAADVLKIQNNIETSQAKFKEREEALKSLGETDEDINRLVRERGVVEQRRNENQGYDKQKTVTIERQVDVHCRVWGFMWHKKCGTRTEYSTGTAWYVDEDQKGRFLQAVAEINAINQQIGVLESKKSVLRAKEERLLGDLKSLHELRKALALSVKAESFVSYIDHQIRQAERDGSCHEELRKIRVDELGSRKGFYMFVGSL